jgi:signal peptidase
MSTNSLAPKYPPGTLPAVKPVAFHELRSGDIVTYQPNPERPQVETQRIVGFGITQSGEKTLITRGGNNGVTSPMPVHAPQVKGRLFYAVPYAGYVAGTLGTADRGPRPLDGGGRRRRAGGRG